MLSRHTKISRRRFLAAGTQAAAGIVAVSGLASCSVVQRTFGGKAGSKMRFGLVTYKWGADWDLPTLLRNCEATNMLGVELRTTHAHGVEPSLSTEQRSEVKRRFADSPVTLAGLGSNERFDSPDAAELAKAIEVTKGFLKLSSDIGSSGVKVKPNDFHEGIPREKTIEQIGKSLNKLGRFAGNYGQQVRVEVHGQCRKLPTIKAIIDVADHPNVVVCWNSNNDDLSGGGLEYNFNLIKDHFGGTAHVHSLDSTNYPYRQLIGLFVKMDYAGWILLEEGRHIPQDRIKAINEQRMLFEKMLAEAQA